MRFLSITALLAVPLVVTTAGQAKANPIESHGFGCDGICLGMFPHIHQHGPLFNYGPYYGYYPFKPYGPWDAYLRYDPFFYGDPYANWQAKSHRNEGPNTYGLRPHLAALQGHALNLFHGHGCTSCGFWHTSWLHGGWFHGHAWLHGGFGHRHKSGCSTCGGVAVASPVAPTDALTRYSGIGDPAQSALFYSATPTLDPGLEVSPAGAKLK
jgi:hypothetical protein